MNEDRNNQNSIVPDIANTSELPRISPTVDAAIVESSPDIPPGDPIIEEPESTETTGNFSSMSKQQEDSGNYKCSDKYDELAAKIKSPLFTKIIERLKSALEISGLLNSLSNLLRTDENELIAEQEFYIELLKQISDLIQQYQNNQIQLKIELDNLFSKAQKLEEENHALRICSEQDKSSQENKLSEYRLQNGLSNRHNIQELEDKLNNANHELDKYQQYCHQLKDKVSGLEISRQKLLAEISSLKQNTGTHYDGTSSLPQHHTLIGEYKDLKEQCLGPLETILFELMRQRDPELKRKERINDIQAIISESILISGHRIMLRDRTSSMKPVTEQSKLDPDKNLSPEVEESQTKSSNIESKFKYSTAGEWQKRDFQQAYSELRDRFYSQLELDLKDLDPKIQTEIEAAIEKILQFLNRAALAEPPAHFQMIEKGSSFDPNLHQAAKNYEDAGKIVKTIYPGYLVNNKPKVPAIVLTEP